MAPYFGILYEKRVAIITLEQIKARIEAMDFNKTQIVRLIEGYTN